MWYIFVVDSLLWKCQTKYLFYFFQKINISDESALDISDVEKDKKAKEAEVEVKSKKEKNKKKSEEK